MRRKPRARVVVAGLVGVVLAVNVALAALAELTQEPSGPPSSSYATSPEGAAAYAELLRRSGHPVRRIREPLDEAELDPATTVVLLDPGVVSSAAGERLARFVAEGGVLVAGGTRPGGWVAALVDNPPAWSRRGPERSRPLAPVPETGGVEEVEADGAGSWEAAGEALPVLAGDDGSVLAVVATRGSGRMTLVADASPLRNRLLARASNAAFGLAVAGEPGRPVEFVESVHGYGGGTGLAAVPVRWRWAAGGLALAALLFLWARGRRLGPPEEETRELAPPRRDYVHSVAALLARTKRPAEAAAPLRAAARERLARRVGASAEADEEALRRAAVRTGLTPDEVAAVLGSARDGTALLGAARALARLDGDGRGRE